MKIDGKFIDSRSLGEKLAYKICQGYDVTVEIIDKLGYGRIIFEHDEHMTSYVEFIEINERDEVEIEYNDLGSIVRSYEE